MNMIITIFGWLIRNDCSCRAEEPGGARRTSGGARRTSRAEEPKRTSRAEEPRGQAERRSQEDKQSGGARACTAMESHAERRQ